MNRTTDNANWDYIRFVRIAGSGTSRIRVVFWGLYTIPQTCDEYMLLIREITQASA